MDLLALATYMQNEGIGTMGQSIFINQIPVETLEAVMIRMPPRGMKFDWELPGYFKGSFQITVRAQTYPAANTLLNSVIAKLNLQKTTIGSMSINFLRPQTTPSYFPLSKGNLIEAAMDFEICYVQN